MSYLKTRKCLHCQRFFKPDLRNLRHHRFCSEASCRQASKKAAQRRWLAKPENRHYFRGALHVTRVQTWRKNNPAYWKPPSKDALQDVLHTQPTEIKEDPRGFAHTPAQDISPLQDILSTQPTVLIGLISKFIGSPLQDDIATTIRALKQLGADVLRGETAHVFARTSETHTQTIQLA